MTTAPALVTLAHGSRDPRSAATIVALSAEIRALSPGLRVAEAYLGHSVPAFPEVVDTLAGEGYDEIVVVPLLLTDGYHARVDVPAVVAAASWHLRPAIRATGILDLDDGLLDVLDARLRTALTAARAGAPDALVLVAAGSSDSVANASVARFARRWGARHRLPVTTAFAASPGAVGEAVRAHRIAGRRRVAVGSLFLAPGRLPERAAGDAVEAGAYAVAAPLGAHLDLARAVLARYRGAGRRHASAGTREVAA